MFAELQLEAQQNQQEQQSLQARKRAASAASSSSSAKQQKLDGMLSKGCKAKVDAKVALLFYAEGIPFEKVGGADCEGIWRLVKTLHPCRRLCDKVAGERGTAFTEWEWADILPESDEEDAELDT